MKAESISIVKLDESKNTLPMKMEMEYIFKYCVSDQPIEEMFREMLINCQEKEENYVNSQNCKMALLHVINEGIIKSVECYDRIKELIKRL